MGNVGVKKCPPSGFGLTLCKMGLKMARIHFMASVSARFMPSGLFDSSWLWLCKGHRSAMTLFGSLADY